MGSIQQQSIRSTIIIFIGFAIGAFNMLVLAPKILTTEELGLTRVITDAATVLATSCTLGSLPIIYKFFPFYKNFLGPKKNDLPFITLIICIVGFIIMSSTGYAARNIIIRKFSEKSPLFVEYSYLVYPFAFFMLAYMWLESFGWSLKKGVITNSLREMGPRILFTIILLFVAIRLITIPQFLDIFSISFLAPVIILFLVIRRTGDFYFNSEVSPVTLKLKSKMINFGLFLFGAQFLNLLSRTIDTFILTAKSDRGLTDAAVYMIANYVVTLMEIPQRSMNASSIPVLVDAWKNKNLKSISSIYKKSVANMLILGLSMFCLMLLNVHNLAIFLGKNFTGIEKLVFFLAIGKLVDLGTGANAQVIATSNYWKADFTTNVIYTVISLPLNYMLISHYQLIGAGYATLIALTFYNGMRFAFLWIKFGLQPYTWKDLLAVVYAAIAALLCYIIPKNPNIYFDTALRTALFSIMFFCACIFHRSFCRSKSAHKKIYYLNKRNYFSILI